MSSGAGHRRFKVPPLKHTARTYGETPLTPEELLRNLGQIIRHARQQTQMTLEDLSEVAGVNPKYLGEVELGKTNPTVLFLLKVSRALELKPLDLFLHPRNPNGSYMTTYIEIIRIFQKLNPQELQRIYQVLKLIIR